MKSTASKPFPVTSMPTQETGAADGAPGQEAGMACEAYGPEADEAKEESMPGPVFNDVWEASGPEDGTLHEKPVRTDNAAPCASAYDTAHTAYEKPRRLSNGSKVLLTLLCALIPGFGQLAGIIISILFMNDPDDDKRSFGMALLVASLILFVISCVFCFVVMVAVLSRRA